MERAARSAPIDGRVPVLTTPIVAMGGKPAGQWDTAIVFACLRKLQVSMPIWEMRQWREVEVARRGSQGYHLLVEERHAVMG